MFETRLYIQFSDKRLKVSSPHLTETFECTPFMAIENKQGKYIIAAIGREAEAMRGKPDVNVVNPFDHPRLVVGDFTVGEKLLQHALRSLFKAKWAPRILEGLMHPERDMEGGLTQVEYRAVRELGENAGCRKVAVHEGRALTMEEVKRHDMRT